METKKSPWHQGILGGKSRDYTTTGQVGQAKPAPMPKQPKPKRSSKRGR